MDEKPAKLLQWVVAGHFQEENTHIFVIHAFIFRDSFQIDLHKAKQKRLCADW